MGDIGGDRIADRARSEQCAESAVRPLRILQSQLHHILIASQLLHPVHHYGVFVLEYI